VLELRREDGLQPVGAIEDVVEGIEVVDSAADGGVGGP
jgi:hypothetical protein